MTELKIGDRVRIKDRTDWYLPTGYKPAQAEGTVYEVTEEPQGYVLVLPDAEIAGFDARVPLGFRIDAVEKI